MITCEEIIDRVDAIKAATGMSVNRATYSPVYQRLRAELRATPEWAEHARRLRFATPDWTEMVVMAVTLDQWRAMVWRRLVAEGVTP